MIHTFRFEDPSATFLENSGGKGANLALLTQRGFSVPRGFVVGATVYQEFIAQADDLLSRIEKFPFGDAAGLQKESRDFQEKLLRSPLPPAACGEIEEQLRDFAVGTAFSIRSSSTMEDLAEAAFAGQHETYLNITGVASVLDRVRACLVSLWSDRAIAYREQQGFDHSKAVMAVVIQQMVASESAGVGFSINPVNGRLNEMLINANFGLGESVVGGDGEVDQWTLDKGTGKVSFTSIGRKSSKIVNLDSGTGQIDLTDDESTAASLNEDQLGQLGKLLIEVENSYGFPQDIEWAFANGKLWLLQSRPITMIPPLWTRDESAERFPNVITPLTWDFVESGFHRSLNHSFNLLGFPRFSGKWFAKFDHYIYGNQNAVELYARRAPFAVRSLDELRKSIPTLRQQFAWVQELTVTWMRDLDHYLVTLGRFQTESFHDQSPLEIWRHVLAVNEHGAQYFLPNIAISIAHGMIYRVFGGLLKLVMPPEKADEIFGQLMAWCETKTGQINRELFELASLAKQQIGLQQIIQSSESVAIIESGELKNFPDFHDRFGRFLRDHGHREVDFDAYVATWCEAPWIVLDNLRLILQTPMDRQPGEKQRELKIQAQQAELRLFNNVPVDLHFFFHELLRLARAYTSLDDLEHYQTTRLTPALRRGLRELGERLKKEGVLAEPMDIFFAHQDQIEAALISGIFDGLAEQVSSQKAAYLSDQTRKPEWILGQDGTIATGPVENILTGLAGSAGVAEGPVFLVLTPEDLAKFPKGAVLVARTTSPAWTPLFYSAAAVITESGGPLSHGAVTAREMKIPAVMSVRESLMRLTNGQRVRVDGGAGIVEILD